LSKISEESAPSHSRNSPAVFDTIAEISENLPEPESLNKDKQLNGKKESRPPADITHSYNSRTNTEPVEGTF
jgi:hypothetical protein